MKKVKSQNTRARNGESVGLNVLTDIDILALGVGRSRVFGGMIGEVERVIEWRGC